MWLCFFNFSKLSRVPWRFCAQCISASSWLCWESNGNVASTKDASCPWQGLAPIFFRTNRSRYWYLFGYENVRYWHWYSFSKLCYNHMGSHILFGVSKIYSWRVEKGKVSWETRLRLTFEIYGKRRFETGQSCIYSTSQGLRRNFPPAPSGTKKSNVYVFQTNGRKFKCHVHQIRPV